MKALTIRQPYCSLVVHGAKPWETRTGPPAGDMRPAGVRQEPGLTLNRGDRLVLHAAAAPPEAVLAAKGVGLWAVQQNHDGTWSGARFVSAGKFDVIDLPLGVVVGSAVVVDAVPICGPLDDDEPIPHAVVVDQFGPGTLALFHEGDPFAIGLDDQLPFGEWEPGRWAWLLDDVKPTTERCPWCEGNGCQPWERLTPDQQAAWGIEPMQHLVPCPVCDGKTRCDPIPARGKQGLWRWSPEVTYA